MKTRLVLLGGCLGLALIVPGRGQNGDTAATPTGHILAVPYGLPPVGSKSTRVCKESFRDGEVEVTDHGRTEKGTMSRESEASEVLEVLSETKLRHTRLPSKCIIKTVMEGRETPPREQPAGALDKLPVEVDKIDDKWVARLPGATPTAAQQLELLNMVRPFNSKNEAEIYGTVPRQPGDRWETDAAKLTNFADMAAGSCKGRISSELVEIATRDGVACAVIKSTYDVSGKAEGADGKPGGEITMKGTVTAYRSLADRTNLRLTVEWDVLRRFTFADGRTATVKGKSTVVDQVTIAKP